ncbi:polyketide synthase dehydratase domain-containing protein, partial [Streptomyces sp. MCAF7]
AVELAGAGGHLFTSLLSARSHPWLADHRVMGRLMVPGTALVELALRAGDQVGCDRVDELTLAAPLVLPEQGSVQLQLTVGEPDETGGRPVSVHSRPEGAEDTPWLRHATGTLTAAASPSVTELGDATPDARVWPPTGAAPLDLDGFYERRAAEGFGYGPVFQGLRAAWRLGDELFAEVDLPERMEADAAAFGLHPALLDAALHVAVLDESDPDTRAVPFSWSGVSLRAVGASSVRVRLSRRADGALSIALADPSGAPVATVDSLVVAEFPAEHGDGGDGVPDVARTSMFRLDWVATPAAAPVGERLAVVGPDPLGLVALIEEGGAAAETHADLASLAAASEAAGPGIVLVPVVGGDSGSRVVESVRTTTTSVLEQLRTWLAEERWADSRLVFVTRGATAAADLAAAPVWGLVRSAQTEHPGRFGLIDLDLDLDLDLDPQSGPSADRALDGAGTPGSLLLEALASAEPQVALRDGAIRAARLIRVPAPDGTSPAWDGEGTVLI